MCALAFTAELVSAFLHYRAVGMRTEQFTCDAQLCCPACHSLSQVLSSLLMRWDMTVVLHDAADRQDGPLFHRTEQKDVRIEMCS